MQAIDAKKLEVGQKVLFTPRGTGGQLYPVSCVFWIPHGVKVWLLINGEDVFVSLDQIQLV